MSHRALLAAAGAQGKTFIEDVFSVYTYAGTGGAQTIVNGIDLTKGGLVWTKNRTTGYGHQLYDTARGVNKALYTSNATAEFTYGNALTQFNNNGFALGPDDNSDYSGQGASWTFQKAKKFFDIITWTGDGTSNRQIPHALGIAPGMVTAKRRDSTGDWAVWHRSATGDLYLDTTAAQTGSFTQITAASATTFSVSGNANINGATYVAYAWAHDPDTVNGIVQCGTFTTDGSGNATVNLGWEPQYVMVRGVSITSPWFTVDSARGNSAYNGTNANEAYVAANSSSAEANTYGLAHPSATGFTVNGAYGTNVTAIYLAIRRGPMRTPTSGASVYNAIARTGTGAAATVTGVGFAPDLVMTGSRDGVQSWYPFLDRLRGASQLLMIRGAPPETAYASGVTSFNMDGVSLGTDVGGNGVNSSGSSEIEWFFRRAPGFFEEVCDTGTSASHAIAHNLAVAPEFVIRKGRSAGTQWEVWHSALANTQKLVLNTSASVVTDATAWNSTSPTATAFSVGTGANVNTNAATYVTYLFASCPGVSKIGSYSGNGATQTINCGFASGARLVVIKRTDSTGDWLILDSIRGIISGNDPYLLLDSFAAENTTTDLLTPQSVGFGLTSNALVNASGGTFIYFSVS